jgi:hypothetical protein
MLLRCLGEACIRSSQFARAQNEDSEDVLAYTSDNWLEGTFILCTDQVQ